MCYTDRAVVRRQGACAIGLLGGGGADMNMQSFIGKERISHALEAVALSEKIITLIS
jgi:hypothetical protein